MWAGRYTGCQDGKFPPASTIAGMLSVRRIPFESLAVLLCLATSLRVCFHAATFFMPNVRVPGDAVPHHPLWFSSASVRGTAHLNLGFSFRYLALCTATGFRRSAQP
jgi:hypothetical protein